MARTANTSRNLIFSTFNFVLQTALKFVIRAIFLRYLTLEYLGLNNFCTQVLVMLSIAELGIGQAIMYSLYKPVADNDKDKIRTLIATYKRIYFIIGGIIILAGLCVMPLLPLLMKDAPPSGVNVYITFAVFLVHSASGYFFAHRRTLIFAYQKQFIETLGASIQCIALNAAQIVVLVVWHNYYAFIAMYPVFIILESVIMNVIAGRMYPELKGKSEPLKPEERAEIIKNARAMVLHKVSRVIINNTDSVVISAFLGLAVLGSYSNYLLVITAMTTFATLTVNAIKSSVGNLIATNSSPERVYGIFKSVNLLFNWMTVFMTAGVIVCFQDFIVLWVGGESLIPFYAMLALCVRFYLAQLCLPIDVFKDTAGLFYKDRWVSAIEVAVNTALKIGLVVWLLPQDNGLLGVILATAISVLGLRLWVAPYILHRDLFKRGYAPFVADTLLRFVAAAAVVAVCYLVANLLPTGGVMLFLAKTALVCAISNGALLMIYGATPSFRNVVRTLRGLLISNKTESNS